MRKIFKVVSLALFFVLLAGPLFMLNPKSAAGEGIFTQTVTLETGWNVFSVPRLVNSHVFSTQETSANFDIYLLDTSNPASWSTMQAMGQTEFTPLFGYLLIIKLVNSKH